jgi:ABC-type multidrug transport system fused ATPase/permease subunit
VIKTILIVLTFCLQANAAPLKSIQSIQLNNQLALTKKIRQIKLSEREKLKTHLREIDSNLNLIQAFNLKEQAAKLHKEKSQIIYDLNKVDSDIQSLNQNIAQLTSF